MRRKKLSSFGKFRRKNFVSVKMAATAWEVTERTIQLWDYREPPRWALRLMDRHERRLLGIDPRWEGFRIGWNGKLYGPYGFQISAEHLRQEAFSNHFGRYLEKHLGKPKAPE